jgi:hypothetical protein
MLVSSKGQDRQDQVEWGMPSIVSLVTYLVVDVGGIEFTVAPI